MADDFTVLGLGVDSSNAVDGLNKVSSSALNMMSVLRRSVPALAGIFSSAAMVGMSRSLISAASDAQEAAGVLNDVFGSQEALLKRAGNAIEELASKYAFSTAGASQQISMTADTFHKFGVELEQALDLSVEINKIGADLANFTNYAGGAEGASKALTKALLGEREMAKTLGIVINEDAIKAQMDRDAKKGLTYATEQQAKMMATMTILQKQSAAAQGKSIKEAGNYATMMRGLAGLMTDLKAAFGEVLIGPFTALVEKFKGVTSWLKNLDKGWRSTIVWAGIAAAGISFLVGAIRTLIGVHRALNLVGVQAAQQRAATAAATQAETAAIHANTAALEGNTAAAARNNAAHGARVAGRALAGAGGRGLLGRVASVGSLGMAAIATIGAAAVNNFKEGAKKGSGAVEKVGLGLGNALTLGAVPATKRAAKALREYRSGAQTAADATLEVTRSVAAVATLGVSNLVAKLFEASGAADKFGNALVSINWWKVIKGIASGEIFRGNAKQLVQSEGAKRRSELDQQIANVQIEQEAFYALRDAADALKESSANLDYAHGASFQRMQAESWRSIGEARMEGSALSSAKVTDAMLEYNKQRAKLIEEEKNLQSGGQDRVNAARKELDKAETDLSALRGTKELYRGDDGKLSQEYLNREKTLTDIVKSKTQELVQAESAAENLDTEARDEAYKATAKALTELEQARVQVHKDIQDEAAKARADELAKRDAGIAAKYIGTNSDEARAGRAAEEANELFNRQLQMQTALKQIVSLESQLKTLDPYSPQADQIERQIASTKAIAGTEQERLAIENEILQKREEEAAALRNIAEREEEYQRGRTQRETEFAERASRMAEDYANKWLSDQQKVAANQRKMSAAVEEAASFESRQKQIERMDVMIRSLSETAKQGGEEGREAEVEMNKLIKERARTEEELNRDRSRNLDDQYAALNEIDTIAESKAQEYAQRYQEWEQANRNDRKPVAVQKAVDAASAEGFAQMNRIFDTSQKKIEDHTKNIKEYTKQMKMYLMQLAAQGNSSWALDVEGA